MNRFKFMAAVVATGLGLNMATTAPTLAQDEAVREITNIKGNLYRFRNNGHFSAFLVTSDGVIATDPINEAAATWLKATLRSRFGKEIKYVIYSHEHNDHVSGGEVFDETATIVAHANTAEALHKNPFTAVPERTFEKSTTIKLGDGAVNLHYFGPSHTDNVIAIEFPAERAVFVVDAISVDRLPYRNLYAHDMPGAIDFIKGVEALDFDIFMPGHGSLGTKADVVEHREYHEDLRDAVQDVIDDGGTLADAKEQIKLEKYRDFENYDGWLGENIDGMWRLLTAK
ncbi:MBL fold metallo-hydrolase [Kordiimonas aquimaris]|uniref:MBL fold metallo-hydrolase n=1 Tax=Kordiimonas aquimaris TaxID=707591 RepID=UPI0021D3544C|nr:MBL fold metallo-hydrolase [Kordiimonas aquimaris]